MHYFANKYQSSTGDILKKKYQTLKPEKCVYFWYKHNCSTAGIFFLKNYQKLLNIKIQVICASLIHAELIWSAKQQLHIQKTIGGVLVFYHIKTYLSKLEIGLFES